MLRQAAAELTEYFAGERQPFSLPFAEAGSEFDRAVWAALGDIPFGETWSYKRLAEAVGRPKASRAVGGANGRNPLPIVRPCHRVVASDGRLGGYLGPDGGASGADIKRRLLMLEGVELAAGAVVTS